jgi:hypothetical protein
LRSWDKPNDQPAPSGAFLILALPRGGKGLRTFQCIDCERPDPVKTEHGLGWLKNDLQPPK